MVELQQTPTTQKEVCSLKPFVFSLNYAYTSGPGIYHDDTSSERVSELILVIWYLKMNVTNE